MEPRDGSSRAQFQINRLIQQQESPDLNDSHRVTFFNRLNQIPGVMQGNPINNLSSIQPVANASNNLLSTHNLIWTPLPPYNPWVWDVPPAAQVFNLHNVNPLIRLYNPGYPNVIHNHLEETQYATNSVDNPSQSSTQTFDRRKFNCDSTESSIPRGSAVPKANPRETQGNYLNNLRTVMESACVNKTHLHYTFSKFDLRVLNRLAPAGSNKDAWFILVDLEVLINDYKFINKVINSDEKCHLVVPKRVAKDLKKLVILTENTEVKRMLRFLSWQVQDKVVQVEEPPEAEGQSITEVIDATCTSILGLNYHLILITTNNDLLSKTSSAVNMYHINEIKNLLMENSYKRPVPSCFKKPFLQTSKTEGVCCPGRDIQSDDHIRDITIQVSIQKNSSDEVQKNQAFKQRKNQDNTKRVNPLLSMTKERDKETLNAFSNDHHNQKQVITKHSLAYTSNIPEKLRKIIPEHSTSSQPPKVISTENKKKQFQDTRKTVTGEEASTSGINLNTKRNVVAHSTNSNLTGMSIDAFDGPSIILKKLIASTTLEQDERLNAFIPRFRQTMEEVLTQVLQQQPSFIHAATPPPPWSLYEAVRNFAIKFFDHRGISGASTRIINMLMRVEDKGNISMTPYQFMQMSTWGVDLLKAILDVTVSCEDIHVAMNSLEKIAKDIIKTRVKVRRKNQGIVSISSGANNNKKFTEAMSELINKLERYCSKLQVLCNRQDMETAPLKERKDKAMSVYLRVIRLSEELRRILNAVFPTAAVQEFHK